LTFLSFHSVLNLLLHRLRGIAPLVSDSCLVYQTLQLVQLIIYGDKFYIVCQRQLELIVIKDRSCNLRKRTKHLCHPSMRIPKKQA